MNSPYIAINTKKIQENTRYIVDLAKKNGVEIYGVGKVSCADIKVAQAMLKGGVKGLADSRISNIKKLKENINEDISLMLLRIPMLSETEEVVKSSVDIIEKTKLSFDKVKKVSMTLSQIIENIDLKTNKVNTKGKEVAEIINQIASVSEESAQRSEEVASYSQEQLNSTKEVVRSAKTLAETAEKLTETVNKFNL